MIGGEGFVCGDLDLAGLRLEADVGDGESVFAGGDCRQAECALAIGYGDNAERRELKLRAGDGAAAAVGDRTFDGAFAGLGKDSRR